MELTPAAAAGAPAAATGRSLSIRNKLLAMVLLPLVGVLPLLGAVLLWWGSVGLDRLLLTKVRSDLAVAHGYFERALGEVGASVAAVAESQALHAALADPRGDSAALLHRLAQRERLDFMRLLPPASQPDAMPDGTSVELLQPAQLAALAPELRTRVPVPLLDTRNAAPSERRVEDRAMVLLSIHAVRDNDGRVLGHVQGGVLLNRNLPFIDHINEIVYPEGSLPFSGWGAEWGSRGTATLFLEDVRISTNVRLFGGDKDERADRAIGTRVSASVRDAVLGRGSTWLDRAFVVNEWYVSGYQPLADGAGRRVGMLYVGVRERPFTLLKYATLAGIGVLFFGAMIGATVFSLRWARTIFRPLEQMEATMQRVENGDLQARVGAVASDDEIGRLARHLDSLLAAIADDTRRLQSWNAELDAKVAERTAALQAAQQQLIQSEKLATVGQLTASIAHEVNNPIAVIQGNLDLVREILGAGSPELAATVAPELKLVDEQIERMRLISTQLLQFARPSEFAGYVTPVDTAQVLADCLLLTRHPLDLAGVRVERDFAATRQPAINRTELQQVLVNLIVNAAQAMAGGGTLTLRTRDLGSNELTVAVADTGAGLPAELLPRLFLPFATQRKEGTGLGLWISRSIVQRYGGEITAESPPGGGACFTVRLRVEA